MSILGSYIKQPGETERYVINYEDDVVSPETLTAMTIAITPIGMTMVSSSFDNTNSNMLISGGTNGVKYKVEVTVTTNEGRVLQDEFFIKIKEY